MIHGQEAVTSATREELGQLIGDIVKRELQPIGESVRHLSTSVDRLDRALLSGDRQMGLHPLTERVSRVEARVDALEGRNRDARMLSIGLGLGLSIIIVGGGVSVASILQALARLYQQLGVP